ncbi:MAG: cation:proton antiporter [Clostridium sp.]
MIKGILMVVFFTIIAFFMGKAVAKLKLPAILGWLISGMILGPHLLNLLNNEILNASWFHIVINICEVLVGVLVGSELILSDLKKSFKKLITICLFEGFGAFFLVSFAFLIFTDIKTPICFIFGAIALATAPAPSLSIIKEYDAKGPVSKTLIPLAALDDILAVIVFFLVIGFVSGNGANSFTNILNIFLMLSIPLLIGALIGYLGKKVFIADLDKKNIILRFFLLVITIVALGIFVNLYILPVNLFLCGISFSFILANLVEKERIETVLHSMNPFISVALIIMILNLGAPLNYKLIINSGILTVIYILFRALGKVLGSFLGSKISNAEPTVAKYLGFALLPHSGVSLVFTGIAVTSLSGLFPEYTEILQGTIASAAVINEIIAVFLAKRSFTLAGEIESGCNIPVEHTVLH